jgi:hypothetical protein
VGMETVELRIKVGCTIDELPVQTKRLVDHTLAFMSKFADAEFGALPFLWEVEEITFGFADHGPQVSVYNLSEEIEKDRQRMLAEGGGNELVGETGVH